ncbi:MAG: tRNA pseudouridine(54/55) synthase Pus10 [Candidatus Micrarchaeia archaeon]|jgi:tRNA pseudouridine synthase 10
MDNELLGPLIDEAAEKIKYWKWDSFSISTKIKNEWLISEENGWDKKLDRKSVSIKGSLNSQIIKALAKKTGKEYNPVNSDGKVVFDFSSNSVSVEFEPIFIFGRYKKLEAGLSQSRWLCGKCEGDGCFKCDWKGRYYVSVEELIGEIFKESSNSKDYVLHASGREDVDVVNLAGRSFVLEITQPKNRKLDLKELMEKVNSGKKVEISNLKIVPRGFVEVVTESHFEKEYEADVEFFGPIDEAMINKIVSFAGKKIIQRTPKRVAHRRADLKRVRKIVSIDYLGVVDSLHKFRICAEAGTYIKELINGDDGRTEHSFAQMTGIAASCKTLKVTRIYDEFLDVVLRN